MAKFRPAVSACPPSIWFYCVLLLFLTMPLFSACEPQPQQSEQDATVTTTDEAATSEQFQARTGREPTALDAPDGVEQNIPQSADVPHVGVQALAGGICDRHEHIQREVLWTLGTKECTDVTDADLASIAGLLDLSDHFAFESLDPRDLQGLTSLEQLFMDLSVDHLPLGIFDDLTALRELRLYQTRIYDDPDHDIALPDGIFDSLSNLESLQLMIAPTQAGLFDSLQNLTRLSISTTSSTNLAQDVFDRLHNLEELFVGYGDLSTLHAGMFDELHNLKVLELGDNELAVLPAGLFDNLTQLRFLNLRSNQLTALPGGIFHNLHHLEKLWLYDNPLTQLPPGAFDNLGRLAELSLGSDALSVIPDGLFDGLTGLRRFSLDYANLETLPPGVFRNLSMVTDLGLRARATSALPEGLFVGMVSLLRVSIWPASLSPLYLSTSLQARHGSSFVVETAEGAPFKLTVDVTAEGGYFELAAEAAEEESASSQRSIVVPAGFTTSEIVQVIPLGGEPVVITVTSAAFSGFESYEGFALKPLELWDALVLPD